MDIAFVRNRLRETIERAKQRAAERRTRSDLASTAFGEFLVGIAVPLVRQVANVLKSESYLFSVFTPSGSVRLMSDTSADDFIEVSLDTSGETPRVVSHIRRRRGGHVVDDERVVGSGDPATLTEEEFLAFLLNALEPFVER